MLSARGVLGPALPVAWPGLCRADLRGPAPRPTLLGRKVWALQLHVGRQGGRGQLQVPPTCPLQGCPEAQPGRQAKEAPPAPGPRCPRHLHLPHGLQRGPAAVAAPCAPLLAQGQLQGQGQPEQCWKGRPNPDLGVASGAGARPGCEARWMALASFPGASGGGRGVAGVQIGRLRPIPPRRLTVVAGGPGDCGGATGNGWGSQRHATRGWGPTPGTPLLASAGLQGGAGVQADASCRPPWERARVLVDLGCLGSDGETEAHGAERLCPVTG